MKVKVLKAAKVLLAIMFALGVLFLVAPAEAQAASKMTNKSAQKILKKKIKNKFCRYAFVDIDNDKIDEMIVLGYSGKFVDGDDKKKSLTVYKVVGKKAKSVLSYSREGDFFHPTLSFNLFYDGSDCYITINDEHEGYATYKTYVWGADSFNEIAMISADLATPEEEYRFRNKGGLKVCTEEEYLEYMKDILAGEVEVTLNSSSTKVSNKYLKKMLKAEFSYRCKLGIYNKKTAKTEYMDVNNGAICLLLVSFWDCSLLWRRYRIWALK